MGFFRAQRNQLWKFVQVEYFCSDPHGILAYVDGYNVSRTFDGEIRGGIWDADEHCAVHGS